MFGTKGVNTEERKGGNSPYLPYGIVKAKINSMVVQKARNTESRRVMFNLEGMPVLDPNFKGLDGARGKSGRVYTGYMASSKAYDDFIRQIGVIADKLGVRAAVNEIQSDSFEDYVARVAPFLSNQFLWWNIAAEAWDEKKYNLKLIRYDFVKSLAEVDESSLKFDGAIAVEAKNLAGTVVLTFDKTNKYHFTPYEKPDESYSLPGAASFPSPAGVMPGAGGVLMPNLVAAGDPVSKPFSVDDLPFSSDGTQPPY